MFIYGNTIVQDTKKDANHVQDCDALDKYTVVGDAVGLPQFPAPATGEKMLLILPKTLCLGSTCPLSWLQISPNKISLHLVCCPPLFQILSPAFSYSFLSVGLPYESTELFSHKPGSMASFRCWDINICMIDLCNKVSSDWWRRALFVCILCLSVISAC